jgi:hypothetical protein
MSKLVYSLVLGFVLIASLTCSFLITHLSARSYANNVVYVPKPDSSCLRFIPQFSFGLNMEDTVRCLKRLKLKCFLAIKILLYARVKDILSP